MKYFLIPFFSLLLTSCTVTPPNDDLSDGSPSRPPYGYEEFCKREPEECSN